MSSKHKYLTCVLLLAVTHKTLLVSRAVPPIVEFPPPFGTVNDFSIEGVKTSDVLLISITPILFLLLPALKSASLLFPIFPIFL